MTGALHVTAAGPADTYREGPTWRIVLAPWSDAISQRDVEVGAPLITNGGGVTAILALRGMPGGAPCSLVKWRDAIYEPRGAGSAPITIRCGSETDDQSEYGDVMAAARPPTATCECGALVIHALEPMGTRSSTARFGTTRMARSRQAGTCTTSMATRPTIVWRISRRRTRRATSAITSTKPGSSRISLARGRFGACRDSPIEAPPTHSPEAADARAGGRVPAQAASGDPARETASPCRPAREAGAAVMGGGAGGVCGTVGRVL